MRLDKPLVVITLFMLIMNVAVAQTSQAIAQIKGYQSRPSGFDMNRNNVAVSGQFNFTTLSPKNKRGLNSDGKVDVYDIIELLKYWDY